jgi:hypothetical protein
VARVSIASVCGSPASSFSVADFCSSVAHSRKLLPAEPSSRFPRWIFTLSHDQCFSAGSFSCVMNRTPNEDLQFSSAVFHFQAPHSWCLALGLGIFFRGSPPGSVISGAIKPCSPRVSSAKRRAPKLFPR